MQNKPNGILGIFGKLLNLSSWIVGLIIVVINGLMITAAAIVGYATGYFTDPFYGFIATVGTSLLCVPLTFGIVTAIIHSQIKKALKPYMSLIDNLLGTKREEEPIPPAS